MLTRNSFLKSLLVSTAIPKLSFGSNPESEEIAPTSHAKGITAAEAASLMKEYRVVPITGEPGAFEFYIGSKRYRYGFLASISLWGLRLATKERHRTIVGLSEPVTTLQAVRIEGKWQYPKGSRFPRDFPIHNLDAAVERLG